MFGRGSVLWGLLLAASAGVAGCSRGGPVKVSGTVTLDGKPLPGATVTFMPAEGSGKPASGRTEEDGGFSLTTFKPGDGALPGEYKITVLVTVSEVPSNQVGDPMQMDSKAKAALFSRQSPAGRAKDEMKRRKAPKIVPEVYSDLKKTPLKCTVPVDGKVELDLRSTAR